MSDTFPDEQGVSDSQTSNRTIVPAKQSIVTTRQTCPLCQARSRQYIDTLISETRDAAKPVIDEETGEILEIGTQVSFTEIEKGVRELLQKFGDDTEFTLADLIIHAGEHAMVTQINGISVKAEGNYLFLGDQVYRRLDLKDSLDVGIAYGLQQMLAGKMKMTLTGWMGLHALKWRMSGNAGDDPFFQDLYNKTQKSSIPEDSPIGREYQAHHSNTEKSTPPVIENTDKDATTGG